MKRRSLLLTLAVVLFLSASFFASPASAQASRVGPTFAVNRLSNSTTTPCRYTDVAWDSENKVYLVVWGALA